jgi:uncharacterized protein (TIGR02217 family)
MINARFPDNIAYGSKRRLRFQTRIVTGANGSEPSRVADWVGAGRRVWDLVQAVKDDATFEALQSWFINARGKFKEFRFKDASDYVALNQNIDISNGGPVYQLRKAYSIDDTDEIVYRKIRKPVLGTVTIYKNSLPISFVESTSAGLSVGFGLANEFLGNEYSDPNSVVLDYSSGSLLWLKEPRPVAGVDVITWDGEFDLRARFDTDEMETTFSNFKAYQQSLEIIELLSSDD